MRKILKRIWLHVACIANRILKIINAPIFIWLLTVLVVSLGGFLFTTYQQCKRDFNEFRDQYTELGQEIYIRRLSLGYKLIGAKNLDDVRNAIKPQGSFEAYSKKSTQELENKFRLLAWRIATKPGLSPVAAINFNPAERFLKYQGLTLGVYPISLTNEDIPEIKNFGREVLKSAFTLQESTLHLVLYPKCEIDDLAAVAVGNVMTRAEGVTMDESLERLQQLYDRQQARKKEREK